MKEKFEININEDAISGSVKATHTISKQIELIPETSVIFLKHWSCCLNHGILYVRYSTPILSAGAPFSATCACVYNKEIVSL